MMVFWSQVIRTKLRGDVRTVGTIGHLDVCIKLINYLNKHDRQRIDSRVYGV